MVAKYFLQLKKSLGHIGFLYCITCGGKCVFSHEEGSFDIYMCPKCDKS